MSFDFYMYYRGCFIVPLAVVCFCLICFLGATVGTIKDITSGGNRFIAILKYMLFFLIFIFFMIHGVGQLANGGIHLFYEKEHDACLLQGEITEVEYLYRETSFPSLETDYGYGEESDGVRFTINGTKCTMPSVADNFEVGDNVTVTYLPQSGYILFISEND